MSGYKHIETIIARYIAGRYRSVVEAGVGNNLHASRLLFRAGLLKCCTDITIPDGLILVPFIKDDLLIPNISCYADCECIFSIRPTEEMILPLIRLAEKVGSVLLIYHLGFEGSDRPSPVSGCPVPLHQYV